MSQPQLFLLPSEEKFDGSNWITFKETLMNAAKARGCDGYFLGNIPRPIPPTDTTTVLITTTFWGSLKPTPEEWDQRNAYALGMITLNVKNTIGQGVKTDGTAAEAWKSLTDVQDLATGMGLLAADNHLRTIRHIDGTDLGTHITAMREAWAKTKAQGGKIADEDFRLIVIASMPKEWNIYISTLDNYKTSAEVIAKLQSHDALLARDRKPVAVQTVQALATSRNPRSDLVCTNPVCGRTGHTIDKCFKPGGGMAGQYPDWWKKKGKNTNTPTTQPSANIAVVPQNTPITHSGGGEFYAFTTQVQGRVGGGPQVTTYADSAASEHCFTDVADFVTYEPYKGNGKTATKGGQFTITGTGRVVKRAVYDKRIVNLSFENAYHCPDLSHNLISIGHLDKTGCFSVFGAGGVTFLNPSGSPFLYGKGVGTMYEVELFPPTGPITTKPLPIHAIAAVTAASEARANVLAFATHSLDKPTNVDTWHR
jgi:hypothetical protein